MSNGQEQTEAAKFDEIWNSDGKPAAQAEPPQSQPGEQAGAGTESGKDTAATGTEGGAGQQAAAAGGTEGEQGASGAQVDDWLAGVDPAIAARIRAERTEAENRFKALHERVAPLQRTLETLQRQTRQPPTVTPPAAPATGATAAEVDSFFESPKWKQWAEDYPGDAEIMRTAFEQSQRENATKVQTLEQRLAGLEGKLGSVAQVTGDIELNRQTAELERVHPDWREVDQSDDFWLWFDGYRATQPVEVRDAWYDPATLDRWFKNADFTSRMITNYKREAPQAPVVTAAQSASEPAKPDVKLRMSESPSVKGGQRPPATVPLESMTPAEQFHHLWNQANKST